MTKLMKIITTIINIIYGFISFFIFLFVVVLWDGFSLFGIRDTNIDRTGHYEKLAFAILGFLVINVILYTICYLSKRRIPILQFAKYSLLPRVIVNLILLGIVYVIGPIM